MAGSESGPPLHIDDEGKPANGASSLSTGREGSNSGNSKGVDSPQASPSLKYTRKNTRGNTRVGSSKSNERGPPDDLEAQLHRSQWLFKVKSTLVVKNDAKDQKSKWDFCILKVPEYDREPPEEFTPVAWRFGLHNRENLDTNGSEAIKISYADAFGLVGDELDKFCNAVVDDPKSMLRCYGLLEEAINWSEDVVKYVLALDALFLALEFDWSIPGEYLWSPGQKASMVEDVLFQIRSKSWADSGLMQFDICKYENQIPFELIERACQYLRKLKPEKEHIILNDDQEPELYQFWEKRWKADAVKEGVNPFMDLDCDSESKKELFALTNGQHILGLAYDAVCGREGIERTCDESQKDYIHIPSATELRESGIKIKGVPEMPLCTMSYKGHYLSLPRMNIYDSTISFIRNMGIYEEQQAGKCMFHDYVLLLLDLIKTTADLELLIDKGVIYNACGVKAFDKWTALEQGLSEVKSSREHHEMKAAIKKRCEKKRYRLWSEFNARFCSRPWLVLSTIAVVLVTLATLIQTYAAIIASNRMKPQFSG